VGIEGVGDDTAGRDIPHALAIGGFLIALICGCGVDCVTAAESNGVGIRESIRRII
jgi:hypothetical protein